MTRHPPARVLVVDPDPHQLDTICRGLALYGHRCAGVATAREAFAVLDPERAGAFSLVLTDLSQGGGAGLEFTERIRREHPTLPVIALVGLASTSDLMASPSRGIVPLRKPFDPGELAEAVQRALVALS